MRRCTRYVIRPYVARNRPAGGVRIAGLFQFSGLLAHAVCADVGTLSVPLGRQAHFPKFPMEPRYSYAPVAIIGAILTQA
jgi:hypothetical protein